MAHPDREIALASQKNEARKRAVMYTNPKIILLNKRSQTKNRTFHMILFKEKPRKCKLITLAESRWAGAWGRERKEEFQGDTGDFRG